MEKRTSVKSNYIYNLIYNIMNLIVPLITAPYTSRVLGADKIGIYSYTYALISTVIMVGALGSATYGQREIAGAGDNKKERSFLFWEIACIKGFFMILLSALFLLYSVRDDYFIYYLIEIPFLVAAVFDISWLFQGLEKFKYIAVRNMIVRAAGVVLLLLLVKKPDDLVIYLLIIGLSQLLGNLSMWHYLRENVYRLSIRKEMIGKHFRGLLVYFIPSVAYQIYAVLDKAMLGWIVGSEYENGYYEQAHKIINMTVGVFTAYTVVMRSRMTYLFARKDYDQIHKNMVRSSNVIALLVFPMSFGLAALAEGMVPWFFGEGYDAVVGLLLIFSPIFIFMGYNHLIGTHLLTPSGRQPKSNVGQLLAALANVIMNAILIPKLYSAGAAIASVISEFIIAAVYYWWVRKEFAFRIIVFTAYKKLIAAAGMFVVLYFVTQRLSVGILSSFLEILIGAAIYGGFLILLRDKFVLENGEVILRKVKRRR